MNVELFIASFQNISFNERRPCLAKLELEFSLALVTFEQGWVNIGQYLLWHGASVYTVSSKALPSLVAPYDKPAVLGTLSKPVSYGTIRKIIGK